MFLCQVCGRNDALPFKLPGGNSGDMTMWLCPEHAKQRGLWYTRGL